LFPAAVTLAVTLLRLAGELLEWSPRLFSRAPGGGLAVVGIAWLVPIVGLYLGVRLQRARVDPPSLGRAAALPLLALALVPTLTFAAARADLTSTALSHLTAWAAAAVVSVGVAFAAWPALGRPLLVYAVLARLPVVVVMWAAIRWGWGTHYDASLPGFPVLAPTPRWLWTGALPQLTIWVAWTVVVGALCGLLGWYVAHRRAA
jgi:hypothetical protein